MTEVPLAATSMNQGDVFLLDNGLELVQWEGDNAGVFEKRRAKNIMDTLKEEVQKAVRDCLRALSTNGRGLNDFAQRCDPPRLRCSG